MLDSLRSRVDEREGHIEPSREAQVDGEWILIAPQLERNIKTYKSKQTLATDVYLVASHSWLDTRLKRFEQRLAQPPKTLILGDVDHLAVIQDRECLARTAKLINDILAVR